MLVLFRYLNMGFQKLNNTDRSVLREYQRNADDKLVYIRVTVILMLDMAKSVEEIEFFWGLMRVPFTVTPSTVRKRDWMST